MSDKKPNGFKDLKIAELRRSAIEDFAADVKPTDNAATILAAFEEEGITWEAYLAQHPEARPEPVVEPLVGTPVREPGVAVTPNVAGVVTSADLVVEEPAPRVVVQETPAYNPGDKLLIKMERRNPVFEVRGHRFTSQNPYALMSPNDATYVLRNEDGFRQAYPDELQEYYG